MPLQLLREYYSDRKRGAAPSERLAIVNARVFDAVAGALVGAGGLFTVVVENGRVVSVAPAVDSASPASGSSRYRVIDAGGGVLMPGLCDAHVHVTACTANLPALLSLPESLVAIRAEKVLEGMLLRGFTTVRDAGGADHGLAQAVEDGTILGPRLLFTGHALSQTGGHGDMRGRGEDFCACGAALRGIGRVCDGVPEVTRAARDELRRGAHCVKIMASGGVASPTDALTSTQFSLAEIRAIVDEADAVGSYVCAHAYTPKAILRAVQCGVRSIEHGNLLDDECAAEMASRGCFLVPTIVTYDALRQSGVAAGMAPELVSKVGSLVERGLESLAVAARNGVKVAFGSDLLGELHRHQLRELALRRRVLGAADVLRHATVNAAELFVRGHDMGQVRPGCVADLLIVGSSSPSPPTAGGSVVNCPPTASSSGPDDAESRGASAASSTALVTEATTAADLLELLAASTIAVGSEPSDRPPAIRMVIKEGIVAASDGSLPETFSL